MSGFIFTSNLFSFFFWLRYFLICNTLFPVIFKNRNMFMTLGILGNGLKPTEFGKIQTRAANETMEKDWWLKAQSGVRKFCLTMKDIFFAKTSHFLPHMFVTSSRIKDVDMHCQVLSIYQTPLKCRNFNNAFTDESLGMVHYNTEMLISSCFQDANLWVWYKSTGEIKKTWKIDYKYYLHSTREDKQSNIS